ncbi:hypothetical protein CA830_16745 [Burkholderia multivorans]|nr:hypothetical protein CA830_16745 [Burkholderia multivorans]
MALRIDRATARNGFNCSASRIGPLRHLDPKHLRPRFDVPMRTRRSCGFAVISAPSSGRLAIREDRIKTRRARRMRSSSRSMRRTAAET